MTHVVAEPCSGCKYTDCVVVCPVECFYEGDQMLYIHPEECIDCEACVPECPVEAIFHEDNLPEEWKSYLELNAEKSESGECDVLTEKKGLIFAGFLVPLQLCATEFAAEPKQVRVVEIFVVVYPLSNRVKNNRSRLRIP